MSILPVFRIVWLQMGEDGDDLQVTFQDGVADGHSICNDVRDAILKSDLKVVAVLTHLEPFYPKDGQN